MWLSLWYPSDGYCLFEGVGDSSAAGSIYVQCLGAFSPAGGLVVDSHFMGYWRIAVNGDGHWSDLDDGMWLSLWYPSDGYCLFEGVGDLRYWRIAVNGDGRLMKVGFGRRLSPWCHSGGHCLLESSVDSSAFAAREAEGGSGCSDAVALVAPFGRALPLGCAAD
ncbi:hypothetical protein CYMTET_44014 [Cymbomonas tetramitiformis]|uniref:Uncharacterized protein n=1 Tax=Cymbomonas tetramitiformis TaxID=36881 RepID=A0AAE0C124_9CHLO|nr:hypothetical protein CYMTET_44014 [Cymbomonas tetramitiformis]